MSTDIYPQGIYPAVKRRFNGGMDKWEIRRQRLKLLIESRCEGRNTALGNATGIDSSYISRMLYPEGKAGKKRIGEEIVDKLNAAFSLPTGWMDLPITDLRDEIAQLPGGLPVFQIDESETAKTERREMTAGRRASDQFARVVPVNDNEFNKAVLKVRKVKLHLSAGITGFWTDTEPEEGNPIYFRHDWLQSRGYDPNSLIAIAVRGESMEPNLYAGDTVVINTEDQTPKDGEVFAVNYEGEAVIKRMVRDAGRWWLSSDNPDQRRFPRKECEGESCLIVGRVIHKQSERI